MAGNYSRRTKIGRALTRPIYRQRPTPCRLIGSPSAAARTRDRLPPRTSRLHPRTRRPRTSPARSAPSLGIGIETPPCTFTRWRNKKSAYGKRSGRSELLHLESRRWARPVFSRDTWRFLKPPRKSRSGMPPQRPCLMASWMNGWRAVTASAQVPPQARPQSSRSCADAVSKSSHSCRRS